MTLEWRRKLNHPVHAFVDGKVMCRRPVRIEETSIVPLTIFGDPAGHVCDFCQDVAKKHQQPTPSERRKRLRDPIGPYATIRRRQSARGMKWFQIAFRLAIRAYPCRTCTFALATHGRFDAAFGIGAPIVCSDCVTDGEQLVDPKMAYDMTTQTVVEALGAQWFTMRMP